MADLNAKRTGIGHSDRLRCTGGSDKLAREGQATRRDSNRRDCTLPSQFHQARTPCRIVGNGESTGARSGDGWRERNLNRACAAGW